jgi:hypothetical protein
MQLCLKIVRLLLLLGMLQELLLLLDKSWLLSPVDGMTKRHRLPEFLMDKRLETLGSRLIW